MKEIGFNILSWSAFAPGLENEEDFYNWTNDKKSILDDFSLAPKVDFLPPIQRRRLSQLTKMSLKVAYDCSKNLQNIESIFASRYGELSQTIRLLKSIENKEEFSPAGFSLSVHNTASGLYSINNKNNAPYTAIAASEFTFEAALIEAVGRLQAQKNILLVVAEEYVEEISPDKKSSHIPFALAILLENGNKIKLTKNQSIKNISSKNMALDFIKWFLKNEKTPFFGNLYQVSANE